jgi:hypothetical protein
MLLSFLTSARQVKTSISSTFWINLIISQFIATRSFTLLTNATLLQFGEKWPVSPSLIAKSIWVIFFGWGIVYAWRYSENAQKNIWIMLAKAFTLIYLTNWIVFFIFSVFNDSKSLNWKKEWQPACRIAAFGLASTFYPMKSPYIKYTKEHNSQNYNQTGDCKAQKITETLWFVKGIWYNKAMESEGLPPVKYEVVMFEDNNKNNLAVQRFGTQFSDCSFAIEGIDRTGHVRYTQCLEGRYILEFKKNYGL